MAHTHRTMLVHQLDCITVEERALVRAHAAGEDLEDQVIRRRLEQAERSGLPALVAWARAFREEWQAADAAVDGQLAEHTAEVERLAQSAARHLSLDTAPARVAVAA